MPIFRLNREPVFPPVELSERNGLLAVGGDLSPQRLVAAYSSGIFPWYGEKDPILWWSPDPRLVLFPQKLHVSRRTQRILKQGRFLVTFDRAFPQVIRACRQTPRRERGTWITSDMVDAYCALHIQGFAHSCEVWHEEGLAGGLYGVALGSCFFGESMFTKVKNASKVALITLTRTLQERGCRIIDCQVESLHLKRLGAELISRDRFLKILDEASTGTSLTGSWTEWMPAG